MSSHRFDVIEKSHATSVSQIYEAANPQGGRYLIEVLGTSSVGLWLEAFRQDMAVVSQLRHPCILEVLDIGAMPDGTPVIVSERPEGTTLSRWLDRGRLATTEAAMDLLSGIGHALGAAHDAGVSHGTLCADDILLIAVPEHALGFPKLRGFGHRWLRAAAAYGDAPTMAPNLAERSVPAPWREIAADIAALATLADRLLTPLHQGPKLASVIRAAQLLGQDGRFATPAVFIEAIELALHPGAPPEEITQPTNQVPWSLRHRGLRRILATAAITVVAAGGIHAMMDARPSQPLAAPTPVRTRLVVTEPPPRAPPSLDAAVSAPRPAPGTRIAVHAPSNAGPPSRAPRLWKVWSDRENKVVYVNDQGESVPGN
jgi:hypothetical protein